MGLRLWVPMVAVLGAALPAAAPAQTGTPYYENYYGVGGGFMKFRKYCEGAEPENGFVGVCDSSNAGFRAFGGYRFSPYLGVELGYTNFGKARADGRLNGVDSFALFKGYGVGLTGVVFAPLSPSFELFAKAGLLAWNVEATRSTLVVRPTFKDSGLSGTAGFGATWYFIPQVGLRAEYERFQLVGDKDSVGRFNIDHVSLSLVGQF